MSRRTSQRRVRKRCRKFDKFVAEGNEKADELAKAGALLDEGLYGGSKSKDSSTRE